ncbi:ABC transporter ATP-binding protein [Candidatus Saccharibacteria bacterium]|nr:ABC transporter ATP-binding protein [Candidatus Saccharibacteria bacterium]
MKPKSNPPLLEISHLEKTFDKTPVLKDINLTLKSGKIYGLLGKNGAGKSTLIKTINTLLLPTAGAIKFKGKPLGVFSKSHISYLPERTYLDLWTTIKYNLDLFDSFYQDFDRKKAVKMLKSLDLNESMKLHKISKGMQEKLQLVLVMSRKADLYILDEPLGGVDPATRDYILDTILTNFADGSSVLISTHLISDIERILDEVIFLDHGEIILTGDADSLREKNHKSIDQLFRSKFKC